MIKILDKLLQEFSKVNGSYLNKLTWHQLRKFKRKDSSIIMTLKCNINIDKSLINKNILVVFENL